MNEVNPPDAGSVEISGLSYSYPGGIMALEKVSLEARPGEKLGLIGPNGAGKSTLFLCILGLVEGFMGEVKVGGLSATEKRDLGRLRREVGLVFQDADDQLFNPTVIEDVAFGPLNLGLPKEDALQRSETALAQVGFPSELFERPPHMLSGGQKRRAAIAGILAMEPSVILLDEPTSDLDPRGRRNLARLLSSLPQTMLIASHDLEFVLMTCDRVALLNGGRKITEGETRVVMADEALMEENRLEKPHSLIAHKHG